MRNRWRCNTCNQIYYKMPLLGLCENDQEVLIEQVLTMTTDPVDDFERGMFK